MKSNSIILVPLLGPGPCWAHAREFICWALPGMGPLGSFICWAPGPCGPILGGSFVGPGPWAHSFDGPCWAHLGKYSQKNHNGIEKLSYFVKQLFVDLILALMSTHYRRLENLLLREGSGTTCHIEKIHISRNCLPY